MDSNRRKDRALKKEALRFEKEEEGGSRIFDLRRLVTILVDFFMQ